MKDSGEIVDAETVDDMEIPKAEKASNDGTNESQPNTETTENDSTSDQWQTGGFDDYADNLLKKKTKAAAPDPTIEDQQDPDKVSKEVENISKDKIDQKINSYDCYLAAKFVIKLLHALVVEGCRWWAEEDSGKQFRVPASELDDLSKMLGAIFYKWQVKIGVVGVFVMMFLMTFGGSMWQAHTVRKEKSGSKKGRRKRKKRKLKTQAEKTDQGFKPSKKQVKILELLKENNRTVKQLLKNFTGTNETAVRRELKSLVDERVIVEDKTNTPYVYKLVA